MTVLYENFLLCLCLSPALCLSLSSPTLLHQAFAYSSTNKILHDQRVTNRILKNNFQKVLQTANVKAWSKKELAAQVRRFLIRGRKDLLSACDGKVYVQREEEKKAKLL